MIQKILTILKFKHKIQKKTEIFSTYQVINYLTTNYVHFIVKSFLERFWSIRSIKSDRGCLLCRQIWKFRLHRSSITIMKSFLKIPNDGNLGWDLKKMKLLWWRDALRMNFSAVVGNNPALFAILSVIQPPADVCVCVVCRERERERE